MKKISPYSVKMWRISGLIGTGIILLIAVGLNIFLDFNALWKYILVISIYGLAVIRLVSSLVMSKYKYKKFWYEIDEEKIILKFGVITENTVVIPMNRVQYVDTEQGVILRKYNLINLRVYTAGGNYEIPYLEREVGNDVQLSITKVVQEISI